LLVGTFGAARLSATFLSSSNSLATPLALFFASAPALGTGYYFYH
jgi:hypothetical protein